MNKNIILIPLFLSIGFIFSGCFATSGEIINLRDDISQLQIRINELQQNQADLSSKMDNLVSKMGPLTSELQETQNRMSFLGQRLDDVESNISNKMNKLSEKISGTPLSAAPSPTEMYNNAYSDYSSGKYDLAIKGFVSYLDKYPNTEMASQAQYYLGECYSSKNDLDNALRSFESIPKNYPKSSIIAASMLKEALILELLGKKTESKEIFKTIMKKYPGSPEASTAKEKILSTKSNAE